MVSFKEANVKLQSEKESALERVFLLEEREARGFNSQVREQLVHGHISPSSSPASETGRGRTDRERTERDYSPPRVGERSIKELQDSIRGPGVGVGPEESAPRHTEEEEKEEEEEEEEEEEGGGGGRSFRGSSSS